MQPIYANIGSAYDNWRAAQDRDSQQNRLAYPATQDAPTSHMATREAMNIPRAEGMTENALAAFEALQSAWGNPLAINSAYRDPEHNKRVGGAKNSQHTHGNAYDIDVSGLSREERLRLIELARRSGFQGIGVYNNALHFDVGPARAWGSDYTNATLPEWARAAALG